MCAYAAVTELDIGSLQVGVDAVIETPPRTVVVLPLSGVQHHGVVHGK